jgi:hypothetical protein
MLRSLPSGSADAPEAVLKLIPAVHQVGNRGVESSRCFFKALGAVLPSKLRLRVFLHAVLPTLYLHPQHL